MSKRFGRQQKRKAIQTRKELEYVKGRYSELSAVIGSIIDAVAPECRDYFFYSDIGDRIVVYRDGQNINLNRVKELLVLPPAKVLRKR